MRLTTSQIREICIRENWFTHGDNEQYSRMFDMVSSDAPIHDIAMVIWTCSDGWEADAIEHILEDEEKANALILLNSLQDDIEECIDHCIGNYQRQLGIDSGDVPFDLQPKLDDATENLCSVIKDILKWELEYL